MLARRPDALLHVARIVVSIHARNRHDAPGVARQLSLDEGSLLLGPGRPREACIFLVPSRICSRQKPRQTRDVREIWACNSVASAVRCLMLMSTKRIVYVIRSRKDPERHYVGLTSDLPARLASHNAGESPQTRAHIPWALVVCVQFASEDAAIRFERFLKSSSGRAFAKHHFE